MPYKNLEHDGVNINNLADRATVKKEKHTRSRTQAIQEDNLKEIAQEAYMNLDNPALWDGEI